MQGMECPARHFQTTYWNIFQGVTILIDLESFDAGPSKTATTGSTISHFYWKYIPVLSQSGINVQPGTSTELGVTTQVVETTEVAKRRFTPEERGCYFEDEIRMVKGLKISSQTTLTFLFKNDPQVNCNPDVGCMYDRVILILINF